MQPWLDGMLPPQIQWKITGKKAKVTDVCCSIIMAVKLQAYLSFFQKDCKVLHKLTLSM